MKLSFELIEIILENAHFDVIINILRSNKNFLKLVHHSYHEIIDNKVNYYFEFACKHNNLKLLKYLENSINFVEEFNYDYMIKKAAKYDHVNLIKYIFKNLNNFQLKRALSDSAIYGSFNIIKFLTKKNIKVNKFFSTPIYNVVANGRLDILKFLIKNAEKFYVSENLLIKAIDFNQTMIAEYLIENTIIDIKNSNALITACHKKNILIVKLLIKHKIDVNSSEIPLLVASRNGSLEIVKLLIKNGAIITENVLDRATPKIKSYLIMQLEHIKQFLN
jgi:hypothetical protein